MCDEDFCLKCMIRNKKNGILFCKDCHKKYLEMNDEKV
jgi:hypothetical protein